MPSRAIIRRRHCVFP